MTDLIEFAVVLLATFPLWALAIFQLRMEKKAAELDRKHKVQP